MGFSLPDNFNEIPGQLLNWTSAIDSAPITPSTNVHIDLRTFNQTGKATPVLQQDLQGDTQDFLNTQTQDQLSFRFDGSGEAWGLSSITGVDPLSFTVGMILSRRNLRGVQVKGNFAGSPQFLLTSSIDTANSPAIDISAMDSLSIVMPDYSNSVSGSYVQLTSNPQGLFSTNASTQVAIPALGVRTISSEIRLPLTAFAQTDFDLSHVTGIAISFRGAAPTTQFVTVMAIRAIYDNAVNNAHISWSPTALDIDTRQGILRPVSDLTGNLSLLDSPIVRGTGDETVDPRPQDATASCRVNVGALDLGGDSVSFILREARTPTNDAQNGSYMKASFSLDANTPVTVSLAKVTVTAGVESSIIVHTFLSNISIVPSDDNPNNGQYIFSAGLTGAAFTSSISISDALGTINPPAWRSPAYSDPIALAPSQGRVGLTIGTNDCDMWIDDFRVATSSFSTMTSRIYESITPVDGAQLSAQYSSDANLWQTFIGPNVVVDPTKTISGAGSYMTNFYEISNDFYVDDWSHLYVEFDIWVGSDSTPDTQPFVQLFPINGSVILFPTMPEFQPNQWNHISLEFSQFDPALANMSYQVQIQQPQNVPVQTWWIDNMTIGRVRVVWQMKAQSAAAAPWRQFGAVINDALGAVHLSTTERGNELQLQAVALTPDAWISSFTLFPHYANLGRPTYYS